MNRHESADDGELSPRDDRLALALARGMTHRAAAKKLGIGERTVYRKLDDPAFVARVRELRTEMTTRAVGRLAGSAVRAAATMTALLGDANPPAVRLAAARAILSELVALRTATELTERMDAWSR